MQFTVYCVNQGARLTYVVYRLTDLQINVHTQCVILYGLDFTFATSILEE
jgi:hypothetical protein